GLLPLSEANSWPTGTNAVRAASQSALAFLMNCAFVNGFVVAARLLPVATIPVATIKATITTRRAIMPRPPRFAPRRCCEERTPCHLRVHRRPVLSVIHLGGPVKARGLLAIEVVQPPT